MKPGQIPRYKTLFFIHTPALEDPGTTIYDVIETANGLQAVVEEDSTSLVVAPVDKTKLRDFSQEEFMDFWDSNPLPSLNHQYFKYEGRNETRTRIAGIVDASDKGKPDATFDIRSDSVRRMLFGAGAA